MAGDSRTQKQGLSVASQPQREGPSDAGRSGPSSSHQRSVTRAGGLGLAAYLFAAGIATVCLVFAFLVDGGEWWAGRGPMGLASEVATVLLVTAVVYWTRYKLFPHLANRPAFFVALGLLLVTYGAWSLYGVAGGTGGAGPYSLYYGRSAALAYVLAEGLEVSVAFILWLVRLQLPLQIHIMAARELRSAAVRDARAWARVVGAVAALYIVWRWIFVDAQVAAAGTIGAAAVLGAFFLPMTSVQERIERRVGLWLDELERRIHWYYQKGLAEEEAVPDVDVHVRFLKHVELDLRKVVTLGIPASAALEVVLIATALLFLGLSPLLWHWAGVSLPLLPVRIR